MKMKYCIFILSLAVLTLPILVSADALDVSVSVSYSEIQTYEDQVITATTNKAGIGVLFVIQPAEGEPWLNFLNEHGILKGIWEYRLPDDIKDEIQDKIGNKIVSYKIIEIGNGGGSVDSTFPDEFTGINGDPSTELEGTYQVIFAFVSLDGLHLCYIGEIDFDCNSWHVIPEAPLGTILLLLSALITIPAIALYKKYRPIH